MRATKVNAGLAESNGRLLLGIWRDSLHVTCGLTACTPGSAPGPTLGNEYGKTLPFYIRKYVIILGDIPVDVPQPKYWGCVPGFPGDTVQPRGAFIGSKNSHCPFILFENKILALEMASPENQHCANCIGTLSFAMAATIPLSTCGPCTDTGDL